MKIQNKLFALAAMFIGIGLMTNISAQSLGVIGRGNGTVFVNSTTPIFEDIANSRIGIGTTNPNFKLDISTGDLNLNTFTNAYRIGDGSTSPSQSFPVLWHNGIISNIYVGVGAGNSTNTGNNINNSFVGNSAGKADTRGHDNTAVGFEALLKNDSLHNNVAIGSGALHELYQWFCLPCDPQESDNTAVGFEALYNSQAYGGCVLGFRAAKDNTLGCSLVAIGEESLIHNINGNDNVAVGEDALHNNTSLGDNVAIGTHALEHQSFSYTTVLDTASRGRNVAVGSAALDLTNGTDTANGKNNTAIGFESGFNNVTGNFNSLLGYQADVSPSYTGVHNSTAIGANAVITGSNQLILGGNTNGGTGTRDVRVGIGLSNDVALFGPRSALEINADPISTTVGTSGGFPVGTAGSGLQFRQLTSGSPNNSSTYIASYGKVLTVDDHGVVKLTEGGLGYGLCNTPTTLSGNIGMVMNDQNIYYDGQGNSGNDYDANNAIGLGYACSNTLPGKLSVLQQSASDVENVTVAGYFHNADQTARGTSNFVKRALIGICDGNTVGEGPTFLANIGGDFLATNSQVINIAVRGYTTNAVPDNAITENVGGWFEGNKAAKINIGVIANTDGAAVGGTNYGISAKGPTPSGNCIPGACVEAAGFFSGDVYTTSPGYFSASDANLKDNIQPLQNAMAIINALSPKTFTYRTTQYPYINLALGVQDGLIAQDVQNVLPQLIGNFKIPPSLDSLGNLDTTGTNNSFLAINYTGIIPYLIGAIKEQKQSNDSLKNKVDSLISHDSINNARMDQLEQMINNCCSNSSGSNGRVRNPIDIDLSNNNSIVLNPASPDPFSEQTKITYSIPSNIIDAKIIFFDNLGHVMQTVTINERGNGQINVYAENLSSGIYSYTLIADGKVIDTKKMVCTK